MKTETHSKLLRQAKHCQVLIYAALGIWTLICLFPFYWTVATSLKGPLDIVSGPVYLPLFDYSPSVDAWRYVLLNSGGHFFQRYLNSIVVASAATALTVFLGAFAVYGLTRYRNTPWLYVLLGGAAGLMIGAALRSGIPAALTFMAALVALLGAASLWRMTHAVQNHIMMAVILASRVLPPVVDVTPIYVIAQHSGMLDTRTALIFVYTAANLPISFWLLQPVFGSAKTDLEEAAEIDGASRLRILLDIVVPGAARGVAAAGAVVFLLCWNEYLFSVYLAPDRAMTMPPLLVAQMSLREQQAGSDAEEWARLAAAVVAMTAPLALVVGFVQRYLPQRMVLRASGGGPYDSKRW
jgi:multiple sugar transport system permease protein